MSSVEAQCRARVEGGVAANDWLGIDCPPGNPHRANLHVLERELRRQRRLAQEWDEGFSRAVGRDLTDEESAQQSADEVFLASRITICELDSEE